MTRPALRVGLIGYGYAGQTFHAPLLAGVPGLQLAVVASRHADKVHADWPQAEVLEDAQALLRRPDIDLVVNQEDALKAGQRPAWPPSADWGHDEGTSELSVADGDTVVRSSLPLRAGRYGDCYAGVRDAIRGGQPPPVTALQAAAVMAWLDLGLTSARERREFGPSGRPQGAPRL